MSRLQYNPPVSLHGHRMAPLPPPKPKYFDSRLPPEYEGRKVLPPDPSAPPPADSDTDSGICADSEQSSSSPSSLPPPHPVYRNRLPYAPPAAPAVSSLPQHYRAKHFDAEDSRDYLTPNSARRLFEGVPVSASPRRLPARPTIATPPSAPAHPNGHLSNGLPNGTGSLARNGTNGGGAKQFRVRFADQIAAGTPAPAPPAVASSSAASSSFPSSITSSPSTSSASPRGSYDSPNGQPFFNGYHKRAPSHSRGDEAPFVNYDVVNERRPDSQRRGYSIDDVENLPEPPSYQVAVQRLRSAVPSDAIATLERGRSRGRRESESGWATPRESLRDSLIRQSIEDTLRLRQAAADQRGMEREIASGGSPHYIRNRSSSLPRGRRSEGEITPLWQHYHIAPSTLAASVDNLHIDDFADYGPPFQDSTLTRRRLPPLPAGPPAPIGQGVIPDDRAFARRPDLSRQRRCRGVTEMISRRSASVGRYPSMEMEQYNDLSPVEYPPRSPMESPVRAQLVALDHRGFRTVLIEKVQPGPFGFYIATGMVNGQRGIFISRVSIASLTPILSIGDEIVYVDEELVKGRSLEYVQSLIAGKTAVTIVLLPTVGPAMC